MSHQAVDPVVRAAADVPRPRLAGALAGALRATAVPGRAVACAASVLRADVELCDQLSELPTERRVVLRRAESEAVERLGVGVAPGAAHRTEASPDVPVGTGEVTAGEQAVAPAAAVASVIVVHGDGWSLVGRTPAVLIFLLDAAPGVVIDRSSAEGAGPLVRGLADQLV